jgi:3-hydroxyisobutyrate dehydrogenase-like beta-hydroxyacid dehydrogenase
VKGVNQLMQGLVNAAHLEAIAFGVLNGIDSAVVEQALGYEGRWRPDFHGTASRVAAGEGVHVNTKYHELPYFVGEAKKAGFELPIAERVQELCEKLGEAEGVVFRGMEAKSYWRALERLAEEA